MRFLALAAALFLAGCSAVPAPEGRDTVTPRLDGDAFVTRDGLRLPLRIWRPEGRPRAVLIALHGMSDYSNAFALPAENWPAKNWAAAGIETFAYDQRGFGGGPNIGLWPGADMLRRDLADFVAAVRARVPGAPVFALGESMGGAVLLTALARDAPPLSGAILVAPAVWSRRDMPLLYRLALFFAAHLTPGLVLSNNAAGAVVKITPSDNVEMLRALARDPLFQKKTRADTLYGLVDLMDAARAATLPPSAPPVLFLYGAHDQIIPAAPTQALAARLGPRVTVRRYERGYHMLLRDRNGPQVSRDIADWVLQQAP